MKITVCDKCKRVPNYALQEVKIIRLECGEDWLGRPKEVREYCRECLEKIFDN